MGFDGSIKITMNDSNNLGYANVQSGWQAFAKTVVDRSAALAGIVVFSPVLIGCAIAIKADSRGPVFYRQARHGLGGHVFHIWKFRSMTVTESDSEFVQASRNDARITKVGHFLRRTSLDELPQLFNIALGDMSLVGPRPHPVKLNEEFAPRIPNFWKRHSVKPGLTGLAQVRGHRGPTETKKKMMFRVQSDLEYIKSWSFWLDMKILIATPYHVLTGKNAH